VLVPHLVNEMAIYAAGEDFYAQALEFVEFLGNCRDFGRSDECEVAGIETENDPLAPIFRKTYIYELAFVKS